jgi:Fe2+ transport system protein FeoA
MRLSVPTRIARRGAHTSLVPARRIAREALITVRPDSGGVPLTELAPGEHGRVLAVRPAVHQDRLVRLSTLGVVPGAIVELQQLLPAAILRIAETTFVVETEIAAEIYVERVGSR